MSCPSCGHRSPRLVTRQGEVVCRPCYQMYLTASGLVYTPAEIASMYATGGTRGTPWPPPFPYYFNDGGYHG